MAHLKVGIINIMDIFKHLSFIKKNYKSDLEYYYEQSLLEKGAIILIIDRTDDGSSCEKFEHLQPDAKKYFANKKVAIMLVNEIFLSNRFPDAYQVLKPKTSGKIQSIIYYSDLMYTSDIEFADMSVN